MEHPLIPNLDDQTLEQLGRQISSLNQKLGFAMRSGNGHLCSQIRMALESYQNKHNQKLQEMQQASTIDQKFTDKIDIK